MISTSPQIVNLLNEQGGSLVVKLADITMFFHLLYLCRWHGTWWVTGEIKSLGHAVSLVRAMYIPDNIMGLPRYILGKSSKTLQH